MLPDAPLQTTVDASTVVFGLLTQLGDTWLLALLAVALYWLGPRAPVVGPRFDRERAVVVLAVLLLALALTEGLKAWFAIDRPAGGLVAPTVPAPTVESLVAWLAGAEGYGFPSGHGVLATAGWGALAWAVRRGTVSARVAVAGTVVVVVGVSRVALGLHTPWQVLAGVLVGAAVLAAALAVAGAARVTALAIVATGVWIGVVGPVHELLVVAGLSVGVALAWYRWDARLTAGVDPAGTLIALVLGILTVLPAVGGLVVAEWPAPAVVASGTITGAALIALPLVGARFAERRVGSTPGRA